MNNPPSERATVHRIPERGAYDLETIHSILDEAIVGHAGIEVDGQPYVIPMAFGRAGDRLYLHGSVASRLLRTMKGGVPMCFTVTHVDALVLARSVFHHSMNYRSVVVLGRATVVDDPAEKLEALRCLTEHLVPGRWDDARGPNDREMAMTLVLSLPLDEAAAKLRTGPPKDEPEDYELAHWAGVLPFELTTGAPEADGDADRPVPAYVSRYRRPG